MKKLILTCANQQHTVRVCWVLVIAFGLFWNSQNLTSYAEDVSASNEVSTANQRYEGLLTFPAYSELQSSLYRLIPILSAAIIISLAFAFYLEEWVAETSWGYRILTQLIAILASVPSLLYGLVGIYLIFFRNSKISFWAISVSFVLLIFPFSVQRTQQAIRDVALSVREAAYSLGANRWQVVIDHVLPYAFSNIVAGICTVVSRTLSIAALIVFALQINGTNAIKTFPVQRNASVNNGESLIVSSGVIILVSMALICAVLASFLKKRADI